jgi:molybdate transport system substrate-binding protein
LIQRMALTPRAGPAAERFFQYLQTAQAREVFSRFGFGSPEGLG